MKKNSKLILKNQIGNIFFILGIILIIIFWIVSSKQIDNEMVIPSFGGTINRVWELLTDGSKLLLILKTIWKLIIIILSMFIPIVNIIIGVTLIIWYIVDDCGTLIFKNESFNKILDFLNKDLNE